MPSHLGRRDFLRTIVGSSAVLPLSAQAFASQAPGAAVTGKRLGDDVALFTVGGSNVLVLSGADGLLMVNGGSPSNAEALLAAVAREFNNQPVRVLFNTDWHPDNTGANDALGKAGAKIIAHENTKQWMGAEIVVQWQRKTYKPRAKEAIPTQSFYTTGKLPFGKEEVQYGHLGQAHTDGDIYVFLPASNILMTGDTFTVGSYPVLDWCTGGWIGGLSDGSRTLAGVANAQTRVIPGNGPIQTHADLQAQADMTAAMRTRFVEMMRKGMSARDMYNAAPTKEFDARWGDPQQFIANAYPGLWNHVREIGGIV